MCIGISSTPSTILYDYRQFNYHVCKVFNIAHIVQWQIKRGLFFFGGGGPSFLQKISLL